MVANSLPLDLIIPKKEDLITDGEGGVFYPTQPWRDFLFALSDFTITSPEVNQYRFCSYLPLEDGGCGECITSCPSGALPNSTSGSNGSYPDLIRRQEHRFWDKRLQFDFGRCCERRGKMGALFPNFSLLIFPVLLGSEAFATSPHLLSLILKKLVFFYFGKGLVCTIRK